MIRIDHLYNPFDFHVTISIYRCPNRVLIAEMIVDSHTIFSLEGPQEITSLNNAEDYLVMIYTPIQ